MSSSEVDELFGSDAKSHGRLLDTPWLLLGTRWEEDFIVVIVLDQFLLSL
jgi:hypothetical protein